MFQVSLTVTTKQKPIIDIRKIKRRESKHTTTRNHQFTNNVARERKKRTRDQQNSQKTINSGHDFPGDPVVKTSPSNTGSVGSIPGRGANIPHASG